MDSRDLRSKAPLVEEKKMGAPPSSSAKKIEIQANRFYINVARIDPNLCQFPVIVANLFRLWCGPTQPQISCTVRRIQHNVLCNVIPTDKSITLPAQKKQRTEQGYIDTPFYSYPEEIKRIEPFLDEKSQQQITRGNVKGMAALRLLRRLFDHHFNASRIGFDPQLNQFVNWDFENIKLPTATLPAQLEEDNKPIFDSESPLLMSYENASVFDNSEIYQKEEKYTLFKLFSTPFSVIKEIIYSGTQNETLAELFYNEITKKISRYKFTSFMDPRFREFLIQNSQPFLKQYCQELELVFSKSFAKERFTEQASTLKDLTNLEKFILNSDEFDVSEKKLLLKNIRIHQIREAKDVEEIYHLADNLFRQDDFKVIRDRSGKTHMDSQGNYYEGKPVSKTFNTIVSAAKIHILLRAAQEKREDKSAMLDSLSKDHRFNSFLAGQRHTAWWNFPPLFEMLGLTTGSISYLEALNKAKKEELQKLEDQLAKSSDECVKAANAF